VPTEEFVAYLNAENCPSAGLIVRMRNVAERFDRMRTARGDTRDR
jgi:hypothetical protein